MRKLPINASAAGGNGRGRAAYIQRCIELRPEPRPELRPESQGGPARAGLRKVGKVGRLVAALTLCGVTAGCSPAAPQDVTVRWLLADGRSCIDAAVLKVTLIVSGSGASGTGSPITSPCPATPHLDARVAIKEVTPAMQLTGRGLSSSNSVLYRGELTVADPVPSSLDLVLYFTGGR